MSYSHKRSKAEREEEKSRIDGHFKSVFGTQQETADALSKAVGRPVSQQSVAQWVHTTNRVPVWVATVIEKASGGRLSASDLRPDVFPESE